MLAGMLPSKHTYRAAYDRWLAEDQHTYTAAVNMRAPGKDKVVAMVKEAWNAVTIDNIIHSFDACGITTHDVNVITCTKPNGMASAARASLLDWKPDTGTAGDDDLPTNADNHTATYDDSTDSYEWENEQGSDAVLPSDD